MAQHPASDLGRLIVGIITHN